VPQLTPLLLTAALLTLLPLLAYAFARKETVLRTRRLPTSAQLLAPALLCVPYVLVTVDSGTFHLAWALVYLVLPIAVAALLHRAARIDPNQNGVWPDYLVLLAIGLAVDLRWLEHAWPPHLAVFSKILLLDAGLWGFFTVRHLHRTGFDLRLGRTDLHRGGLNFLLYTPIAIALGLSLGFLHIHRSLPHPLLALATPVFTFFFVAVPEELFFRGWLQNLLQRRLRSNAALAVTSVLFGLSHFNKRAVHFNWRYVLLATIAGVFYGRAWRGNSGRNDHRVAASALTHTLVDSVWSLFLR
jgi:uncharacterized protein